MRISKAPAILALALFASTGSVVAQTGEFASPVPGSVVHQGYALQDWWQNARNPAPVRPPVEGAQVPKPRQVEAAKRHQNK